MARRVVTITRRTRCLGSGWTNNTTRIVGDHGDVRTGIAEPGEQVRGSVKRVSEHLDWGGRVNSGGTYWRSALFVNGARVVAMADGTVPFNLVSEVFWKLERHGRASVLVQDEQ